MKDSLTLIVLVGLMFYQNWNLALFALIMMPLAAIVAKSLGKRIKKAVTESTKIEGGLTSYLSEVIKGTRMIKIYQQENFEFDRSTKKIDERTNIQIKIGSILIRATPIMEILTGIMIGGFVYYSGFMIANGQMQINNFFSFLTAMMLAYQPIRSLATINMLFNQGAVGADRVFNVLDAAIKNINISIEGSTTVALVGHSGAGKSTIVNLLPRFYDPQKGAVYIDEQNISSVTLSSLRKNISMVSQDIVLFDDTVRANVAYANMSASEKQIKEACDLAAAGEFIENLPQKFETIIGENGVRLSGGEKQRISIARAFLKNSPIILLDEATSSLDAESEEKVQNAIMNLTKNRTTLVIAHRLSTIIRADKIILVNRGEIYFWYRFFTYLFYPFAPIYLYFRKIRKKEDSISYREKLSKIEISREEGFLIWFHVASVGEAMSILPLIESCMEEKKINKILLTSITLSSGKILKKRFNQNAKVIHQFLPLDISVWTSKFLEHWKPNLSIFIDSEIWPNLILKFGQT